MSKEVIWKAIKRDGMRVYCMRAKTFIINPGQKVRSQFFNQKLSKKIWMKVLKFFVLLLTIDDLEKDLPWDFCE